MRKRILPVMAALCCLPAGAQEAAMDAGSLAHEVDRLAVTARVLYVAAHPDDENTRLLAYLANGRHLAAAYLSMTRGGGGQNLIGPEQAELLDVVRTEELMAARGLDGARQFFTRARDFGYSKSADETFSVWGHEAALADVVWVLRTFQPDVVITRFDEKPPNHGHHTASAILAREAFAAAGDPTRFPEQLAAGAMPWKATRLLHNVPTWRDEPPPPSALPLDVGAYDPRLGLSFGELAARSRSQHQSQGFGVPGERGSVVERFLTVAGSAAEKDLLDGVPLGWDRYGAAGAPVARALEEARDLLDRDRPERAVPALVAAMRGMDALPGEPRTRDARRAAERAIAAASGLFVRATANQPGVVPGAKLEIALETIVRRPSGLEILSFHYPDGSTVEPDGPIGVNAKTVMRRQIVLPAGTAVSVPYWLQEQVAPDLVGRPRGPAALEAAVTVRVSGRTLRLTAPVQYAWTDPVRGERLRDVLVMPPATVTASRQAVLAPNASSAPLVLKIRAARDEVRGEVTVPVPAGWRVEPASATVALEKAGDATTVRFALTPPPGAGPIELQPQVVVEGRAWSFREDVLDHPHIPMQVILRPSTVRAVPLQLQVPGKRIGYVMGSGDSVADDLTHVGAQVEILDDEALRAGDLSRFAAIVTGIRAYNTRDALRAAHDRLMRYVEDGGTVVVQYNTQSRLGPLESRIAPFPLEIGRGRVTDERAAMEPLAPDHEVLVRPHRITASDFAGWVQERGLYFAENWDPRYTPIFAAADPGESPLRGGLLFARHGKGRYVYTGLAFFRQLPAGVPGAYRLFFNLIGAQ
ncbi:MAG TPA: PIG-L family deacetylase [Candidatus Polarisedimenticolaceae bacterium]|nr:PIG-L family deacetylase [Candidatus Polarisedimenticolaceae bacterium]